ncbi:DUF4402 domain-containing protein [Daejeonella oryzae]|uniref:DUF4402 domain-containing protein n=1 Tax=Daejeonella oryzae TaxID=1122943 RepID=UPI0004013DA0|nr:DUF4402 domain-containing protein [Daejeonella oryzae]
MKKIYLLALAVLGFSANSFAQATATASSSATIISPIAITKTADLNFGQIFTNPAAGTVVLDVAGVRTASVHTLFGSAQTRAQFDVTGSNASTFSITLPASPITLNGSVSGIMTVDNFVSDLGATGTLVAGAKTIIVGATLNIPAAVPTGVYTNASGLAVTVNYN